jgi:hypothetical protein
MTSQLIDGYECWDLPTDEARATPSFFSKRRLSLNLMRLLLIAAIPGTVFGWILWLRTVRAGISIYILREGVSSVLTGTAHRSWFQWLVDLDLSSFAAAIFLLVMLRFVVCGFRHCVLAPRRAGFWSRAHGRYLFSEEWSRLILRLGLIGTLVSFIFAALTLIGDKENQSSAGSETQAVHKESTAGPTAAVYDAEIGQESTNEPARRSDGLSPGASGDQVSARKTTQSSDKIFLLLCAALFGILVGCVLAFVVMPLLEKLNGIGMGRHLIAFREQAAPEEEQLLHSMVFLNQELEAFARNAHTLNETLAGAQRIIQATERATDSMAGVKSQFDTLNGTLTAMTENVGTVAKGLSAVVTKLDVTTERLKASNENLEQLPAAFNAALAPIGPALKAWSEVGETTRRSEEELLAVAKCIQQPIGLLAEIARRFQPILQQVALFAARASEERGDETAHLVQLKDAFAGLSRRLETFSKALEKRERDAMSSEEVSKRFYEDVVLKVEAQDQSIAEHSIGMQTVLETLEEKFAKLGTTLAEIKAEQRSQRTAVEELRKKTLELGAQVKSAAKRAAKPTRAENGRSWGFRLFGLDHTGNHAPTSDRNAAPAKD